MHHCACKADWPTFKPVILVKFLAGANSWESGGYHGFHTAARGSGFCRCRVGFATGTGHSLMETTAIYANAVGEEQQNRGPHVDVITRRKLFQGFHVVRNRVILHQ
jgi:hypothetical protein